VAGCEGPLAAGGAAALAGAEAGWGLAAQAGWSAWGTEGGGGEAGFALGLGPLAEAEVEPRSSPASTGTEGS
jgi:hypothetical protein